MLKIKWVKISSMFQVSRTIKFNDFWLNVFTAVAVILFFIVENKFVLESQIMLIEYFSLISVVLKLFLFFFYLFLNIDLYNRKYKHLKITFEQDGDELLVLMSILILFSVIRIISLFFFLHDYKNILNWLLSSK
jgi:hypothetical protein